MTAIQKEAIDMIHDMPDDMIYYVIQFMKNFSPMEPVKKTRRRIIGIAEGEKFLADGYDMDAEDPEIIALFEDMS